MRKIFLSLLSSFFLLTAFAQEGDSSVVKFEFGLDKKSDREVTLRFKAKISEGWKLLSVKMGDDDPNTRIAVNERLRPKLVAGDIQELGTLVNTTEPVLPETPLKYFEKEVEFLLPLTLKEKADTLSGTITYMALKGDEFTEAVEVPFKFIADGSGGFKSTSGGVQAGTADEFGLKKASIDIKNPMAGCGGFDGNNSQKGLLSIFLLGFLGGLVALFTPCVFPIIPLTVTFFTKRAENRKKGIFAAVMYGVYILLTYLLLSLPFHLFGSVNPEIFNNISTNIYLNIAFFVVFVVFALSFFGLFEIKLPSGLANKMDAKAGLTSQFGILFMALTLVIVSFSCTGPILGSLLAGSLNSDGGPWQLTAGLGGFGLALGIPFTIFALFPRLLKSIPKSGGWLSEVKVVLGFVELGLAFKFLSNADLVVHWGLLKREIVFGIWILLGLLTSLYIIGIIRFKGDSKVKKYGIMRMAFFLFFAALTIYMVPGLTKSKYANRKLMSGFPPPLSYSLYGENAFKGVEAQVVNDYEKALALAKAQNKPLLIDFTGWACVNCRKMEENVWIVPEVKELIEKDFILLSLYVDDRKPLPEEKQFIYTDPQGEKKKIITEGDKFATLEAANFNFVAQPLYVVLTPDEKLVSLPKPYTPDANEYAKWLKCSLEAFRGR